jgi:hypothetical protein
LSGRKVFTVDASSHVEECLAIVKSNLGEGFDHLCNIRILEIYKYPVLGWIVTTRPFHPSTGKRGKVVSAKPIVLWLGDIEQRQAEMDIDLGYVPDYSGEFDALKPDYELSESENVIGVLPSWPDMYYVVGYVNDIAFVLGVHVNPDDKELVELLLRAYLDWLKGPEARRHKSKLAKPKTEPER